jgi:transposase InsO family protein
VSIYRFIAAERATFGTKMLCRHLNVSTSAFYDWARRPPSRRELDNRSPTRRIREIHEASRGTYGAPRVCAELRADGVHITRKRVARLMRAARIQGVHIRRRRWRKAAKTRSGASERNRRRTRSWRARTSTWVADITRNATGEGWLHLAAVEDLFSRRIVGWAMAPHLRAELLIDAVEMAITNRKPTPGLVHHSDQGSQFTSIAFGRKLRESGILPSMGAVGTPYDNAVAESFFSTAEV